MPFLVRGLDLVKHSGVWTEVKEEPLSTLIGTDNRGFLKTAASYNTAIIDCNDATGDYWKGVVHPGKNVVPASLTIAISMEKKRQGLDFGNDVGH
jgi:2-methylcitrate dehydratase PrpD